MWILSKTKSVLFGAQPSRASAVNLCCLLLRFMAFHWRETFRLSARIAGTYKQRKSQLRDDGRLVETSLTPSGSLHIFPIVSLKK